MNSSDDDISPFEKEIIKKYRSLDDHGKEMVDFTLEKEYERSVAEKKKSDNVIPMAVKESSDYEANAAHPIDHSSIEDKTFDEDIMNSEDF